MIAATDIVDVISRYITLNKKGQNYVGLCPFHDDRNPSFSVNKDKGVFKCFVCNTGGNAIRFVQLYEKVNYFEAARRIAESVNFKDEFFTSKIPQKKVDVSLEPLHKAINDLTAYYQYVILTQEGQEAKDYLHKRGLDDAIITRFKIGYAPLDGKATVKFLQSKGHSLKSLEDIGILSGDLDQAYDKNQGRLIFALSDSSGQTVGFSARTLSKDKNVPKYINSPETKLFIKSNNLYNYHYAKDVMNVPYIYLVEGFLDVIALERANIRSAVALMGTAFTKEQLTMLKRLNKEVRVWLDSDLPGRMATMLVIKDLSEHGINFQIVRPDGEQLDPDDYLKKYGVESLRTWSTTFDSKEAYTFNYYKDTHKLDDIESTKKFVNDVMRDVIVHLTSKLEVSAYIDKLSEASGFNTIVLHEMYNKLRKSKESKEKVTELVSSKLPLKQTLNRITQAERFIVNQMVLYPEAREFFNKYVKVFNSEVYRYIANYINEYGGEKIEYKYLLNDVYNRITDEDQINLYTNEIISMEEEHKNVVYDEYILNDALNLLQYEREIKLAEKIHSNNLLKSLSNEEFAAEKTRFLQEKMKINKKYKRK